MRTRQSEVTELLQAWSHGEAEALDRLMPLVFDDIRDVARRALAHETPDPVLQTTALVNEVYLRLADRHTVQWQNRALFLATMAGLIRRLLVDHARRQKAAKRGGGTGLTLDQALSQGGTAPRLHPLDLIALDEALDKLKQVDPEKHRIVELRYFMDLTEKEISDVLGFSVNTVQRRWQAARLWLKRELDRRGPKVGR